MVKPPRVGSVRPRFRHPAIPLLAACLAGACLFALADGQPARAADLETARTTRPAETGMTALKGGQFGAARAAFTADLQAAQRAGDTNREAEARFFLGLADQHAAESQGTSADTPRRDQLLASSERAYRQALALRPASPGILNNLAQVQIALRRTNDALASLARAVEVVDPRRAFYALNYADLLLAAGRWRDACQFYALVATEQPQDRAVHTKLVDLCVAQGPDLLAWYLWDLARAGQVLQVEQHALRVLDQALWQPQQREELLALVAFCLAQHHANGQDILASATGQRLRELAAISDLGNGIRELIHLLEAKPPRPEDFPWWASRFNPAQESSRGLWPFEAFLHLVRSLADRAGADQETQLQEDYLLVAVGANRRTPDPDALLRLANLYSEQRAVPKLDALMERYEVNILEAKGEAYTAAQTERIYRYHMALGVIYSQLERWTTPRQVNSAMFQLNLALRTADQLNQTRNAATRIEVPPRLVNLLADGYHKVGRPEEAFRVRLDRAEIYLQNNRPEAARAVLAPAKSSLPANLDATGKARFQRMDEAISRPTPAPSLNGTPATRVQIGGAARTVAGDRGYPSLTDQERKALETTLNGFVGTLNAPADLKPGARAYRSLGTNAAPEVQEVTVSGRQGHALLRRGTNLIQVPFTLDRTNPAGNANLRFVKP